MTQGEAEVAAYIAHTNNDTASWNANVQAARSSGFSAVDLQQRIDLLEQVALRDVVSATCAKFWRAVIQT